MSRETKVTMGVAAIVLALMVGMAVYASTPEVNIEAYHLEMPATDEECLNCHGDVLEEVSLDPDVSPPHPIHQEQGLTCTFCHESVDLVQESAASLRRDVDVSLCAACHSAGEHVWYQGGE